MSNYEETKKDQVPPKRNFSKASTNVDLVWIDSRPPCEAHSERAQYIVTIELEDFFSTEFIVVGQAAVSLIWNFVLWLFLLCDSWLFLSLFLLIIKLAFLWLKASLTFFLRLELCLFFLGSSITLLGVRA